MTNKVLHGDCLELMKDIPDKSIDMILCDLPYGTTACKWDTVIPFREHYKFRGKTIDGFCSIDDMQTHEIEDFYNYLRYKRIIGKEETWYHIEDELKASYKPEGLWDLYERIIKDNGAIVLTASQPFTSALVMSNIKMFKYEWIWGKNNSTGFQLAKKMPLKKHENIPVFYKKQCTYKPQGLIKFNKINKRGGIGQNWRDGMAHEYLQEYTNYPTQTISFSKEAKTTHPTQKPVALFEYLIKTYTNEGDLVLDNCAGSGTTAIACLNTNRNYILIEQEQEYIDVCNERILKHTEGVNK